MRKTIIILTTFFLISVITAVYSKNNALLEVQVVNFETKLPLSGAIVVLAGEEEQILNTNSKGRVIFSGLSKKPILEEKNNIDTFRGYDIYIFKDGFLPQAELNVVASGGKTVLKAYLKKGNLNINTGVNIVEHKVNEYQLLPIIEHYQKRLKLNKN